MTNIRVASQTQHINVDPGSSAISVINSGPIGPAGPIGEVDMALLLAVLTTDGDILSRDTTELVRLTREALAGDSAFLNAYIPQITLYANGQILTRAGGVVAPITRANLAADSAFASIYANRTEGSGAPGGSGTDGHWYYDTTAKRLYMSDGTGWIIMSEPVQVHSAFSVTPGSGSITTVGTRTTRYQRSNGKLSFQSSIAITTNGTGAANIVFALPVNATATQSIAGTGRENNVTGSTLQVVVSSGNATVCTYGNAYPAATGAVMLLSGEYEMVTKYS